MLKLLVMSTMHPRSLDVQAVRSLRRISWGRSKITSNGSNWAEAMEYLHTTVNRFQATDSIEYEVVGNMEGLEQIGGGMLVLDSR